jgi:hypothetical protein
LYFQIAHFANEYHNYLSNLNAASKMRFAASDTVPDNGHRRPDLISDRTPEQRPDPPPGRPTETTTDPVVGPLLSRRVRNASSICYLARQIIEFRSLSLVA